MRPAPKRFDAAVRSLGWGGREHVGKRTDVSILCGMLTKCRRLRICRPHVPRNTRTAGILMPNASSRLTPFEGRPTHYSNIKNR